MRSHPSGIRFSELLREIHQQGPETLKGSIGNWISGLDRLFPSDVSKPSRGLFLPYDGVSALATPAEVHVSEEDFYQPFADYLKNELEEVVSVVPLGGAGLKEKWGTPDVVGVYKPLAADRVKFNLEVVSAEIKIDPNQSVTAFGQAAAYRLFSTKVYIAMPNSIGEDDLSRLESLCVLFGIGLVVFALDAASPQFSIRVRAQRFMPDMYYVNRFADRLCQHNREAFQKLFG